MKKIFLLALACSAYSSLFSQIWTQSAGDVSVTGANLLVNNINTTNSNQNGFLARASNGDYGAIVVNPSGTTWIGGSKGVRIFSNTLAPGGVGGGDRIDIIQGGVYSLNKIAGTTTGWGIKKDPTTDFDVNGNAQANSFTVALNGGINQDTKVFATNRSTNFASLHFYPANGTDVGQSLSITPKGVGSSNLKSQIALFNTDYVADPNNYEAIFLQAVGMAFGISSRQIGTGTLRPIFIDATNGLSAATSNMYFATNGSVGIGTASPSEKLSVNGNIKSKKVIVTQTGWADYVFDPSYKLPSLDSISSFIKANRHLPEMPSAAAIEKDGQDLGEIQKLLLKKVE